MAVDVIVDGFVVVDGAVEVSATIVDDSAQRSRGRRLIEQPRHERGIELLEAVVAMLTKMITVESST